MSRLRRVRRLAQRFGVDIARYPGTTAAWRRAQMLTHHGIATVIDVGANAGQFGAELRRFGFTGRIISFEPVEAAFARLQARAGSDPRWQVLPYALGDTTGEVSMHVAANQAESSSILPMLDAHVRAAPEAGYVATQAAQLRRLDDIWPSLDAGDGEVFLKLDVQGYERQVLAGGGAVLPRCCGLQLEVSFVPLYEGGMLFDDALPLARSFGYELWSIDSGFTDPSSGRMLQADATFYRP